MLARAPGTIPLHVSPPRGSASEEPGISLSTPSAEVATAASNPPSEGFFSSLARKVGLGTADTTATAQPVQAKSKVAEAKVTEPKHPQTSAPNATAAAPKAPETKQAAAPTLKPSLSDLPAAAPAAAAKDDLVAGAQPIVSSTSFDSRFSAVR
jgi:hypothetical protein